MSKRERVINAVKGKNVDYVPTGFWLHFPEEDYYGEASVQAHLKFLKETDVDIVKIMNENLVPWDVEITKAEDWKNVKPISLEDPYIQNQLEIIRRISDEVGDEAIILTTIHGIVASAFHTRGGGDDYDTLRTTLSNHLRENPEVVSKAFNMLADGLAEFAKACLDAGAQGIYYAALGGEKELFTDEEFEKYIKPNDLKILNAANEAEAFNVLHICKDGINFDRYKDYNPEVVNWAIHDNDLTLEEGRKLFPKSTILGGLDDRSGVLVEGTEKEIQQKVKSVIDEAGKKRFIIGSDCTLPTEIDYKRIKAAVEATKKYR